MHQKLLKIIGSLMAMIILLFFIFSFTKQVPTNRQQEEQTPTKATQNIQTAIDLAKKMPLDTAIIYLDSLYQTISTKYSTQDSMVTKLLYRKGAQYFKAKKYEAAIELFKNVQLIQKKIYPESHSDIAKIEHLLGEAYQKLKKNEVAIKYFQEAARLRLKYNDSKLSKSYNKLGNLYREKGDFSLAEKHLQLTLAHDSKANPKTHHHLALVKYDLDDFEAAFSHLDSALVGYSEYPEFYQKSIPRCYTLKASINDDLKQYEAALSNYKKAIDLLEKMDKTNNLALYDLYNNLSITYKKLNRDTEALQLLEKLLRLKKEQYQQDFHDSYAANYNNFGDIFLKQKKYETALSNYQLAIQNQTIPTISTEIEQKITLNNFAITGLKTEFLTALFSKAKGLQIWSEASNNIAFLEIALHTLESCCELIDVMRQEQSEEVSKLFWREQTRPIYEKAIEVAYQLGQAEKAYEFFEKSKAALLLDALKNETANRFIPPNLVKKKKALQKKLSDLEQELSTAKQQETQLIKILEAREELNLFFQTIETDYPSYYDARYNTDIPNLSNIQTQLATKKATLIEYVLTKKYIYALVIDDEISLKKIPKPIDFQENTQQFLTIISQKNRLESNQGFKAYLQIAEELHESLIAPLNLEQKRLIIVPDGVLNYIPFEALVQDATAQPTRYVLQDYTISYAYSSTILLQNRAVNRPSNGQLWAVAPTRFQIDDLVPLSLSEQEATSILAVISGQKNIGKAATVSNFEKNASSYSILHLSTHASASDSITQHPWIAFYDSLLLLPDIYHLNLNADLVVLSACETSKGDLKTGEGVMSLARGFAYAGVPSTLTSLWEVNERATSDIMQLFYKNIEAKQPKDVALQQAKLVYLEQHPEASPHFWAAFVPIGNMDALSNLSASFCTYTIFFYCLILVLLIGICWYYIQRFHKK